MNKKEIGELRRHIRKDRCNITEVYGCYVNSMKEIVSEFRQSLGIIPENESDKYFGVLRRVLSGTIGRNLIDISFKTAQVADSEEHRILMTLRDGGMKEEAFRMAFYQRIIDHFVMDDSYLILVATDSYDVPFRSKDDALQSDASGDVYRYALCAICPVKLTKAALHYVPEEGQFHDGGILQSVQPPTVGFLFPAFDDRASNIYNVLYYTKDVKTNQDDLVDALFKSNLPLPAEEQKNSFQTLLADSLDDECSMDVVHTVHDELCQKIAMHKESKVPDTLMVSKGEIQEVLEKCGVSEEHLAKFSVDYDSTFGFEADLHPGNLVNTKRYEVRTPDVSIRVDPTCTDLVEMRTIGGVKYVLVRADGNVEVNGISVSAEKA